MIGVLKIQPTYCVDYSAPESCEYPRVKRSKQPALNTHAGELSDKANIRMKNAINWLIMFSPEHSSYCSITKTWHKFTLNFITLTLSNPQRHDDVYIKRHLLAPFLKWLDRKGVENYVWKAETQNNGNIHFHITTNVYIHWQSIRNKWNQLQYNHGYMDGRINADGSFDTNSTDVHAVRKPHKLVGYILKYMAKNERWCKGKGKYKSYICISARLSSHGLSDIAFPVPKRHITGKLWGLSNSLSNINVTLTQLEENAPADRLLFLQLQFNSPYYKFIESEFFDMHCYSHLLYSRAPSSIANKFVDVKNRILA